MSRTLLRQINEKLNKSIENNFTFADLIVISALEKRFILSFGSKLMTMCELLKFKIIVT